MKHSTLSLPPNIKTLDPLEAHSCWDHNSFFFYATYIVHKIAKHLDQDMASQAAVTAESSIVPEVIFIYVFIYMMDL